MHMVRPLLNIFLLYRDKYKGIRGMSIITMLLRDTNDVITAIINGDKIQ